MKIYPRRITKRQRKARNYWRYLMETSSINFVRHVMSWKRYDVEA